MSIGNSGRVVVEIDPSLKKELYASLVRDGLTLKDWFVRSAESYMSIKNQLPLGFDHYPKKEAENETTE